MPPRSPVRAAARDMSVGSTELPEAGMSPVSAPPHPWVGRALPRAEDARFVKGEAKYAGDLKLPDMLHAAFVRSMYAHGRIVSVDTDAARRMPGVRAILTAADVDGLVDPFPLVAGGDAKVVPVMHPVLASDRV